ncbi:MAG TPA: hypothetical protein VEC36_07570 [Patescibacteria group bacterium]|nr:hypothetical protein [Patescibacteria group bacterium]
MRCILALVLLLLPISFQISNAQLYVTRNAIMNPFADTVAQTGFMPSFHYSHEFARGFGSAGGEQAWNGRSIGLIEFYRWESGWSLGGILAAEAGLNDSNDIGFNPRSIRWMEEIALYKSYENYTFKVGVQHQCKHDVDNSDGASGDTPIANSTKRVTILSGMNLELISMPKVFAQDFISSASIRADYYFAKSDYRFPNTTERGDLTNATGALLLNGKIIYRGFSPFEMHAQMWGGTVLLAYYDSQLEEAFNTAFRFEAGVSGRGSAGALTFFTAFEHYFDDMALPVPQKSSVLYFGIRGSSLIFF